MPDTSPDRIDDAIGRLPSEEQALARAMAAVVDSSRVPAPWDWSGRAARLLITADTTTEQTQDQLHQLHQAGLLDLTIPLVKDPSTAVLRYRMPASVAAHLASQHDPHAPGHPGIAATTAPASTRLWTNLARIVAHALARINPRPPRYSPILIAVGAEQNLFADTAAACAWIDGERDTLLRVLADAVAVRNPVAVTLIEAWDIWRRYPRHVLAATQRAGIAMITADRAAAPGGHTGPAGWGGLCAVIGARLAHALVDLGRVDGAVGVSDQAWLDARAVGDAYAEATALAAYAHALTAAGHPRQALRALTRSRALNADERHGALLDRHSAQAHHALGEYDTALVELHSAHRAFTELGDTRMAGRVLTHIAEVLLDCHRPTDALQMIDAAIAVLRTLPPDSALVAAHTFAARAITATITGAAPPPDPAPASGVAPAGPLADPGMSAALDALTAATGTVLGTSVDTRREDPAGP